MIETTVRDKRRHILPSGWVRTKIREIAVDLQYGYTAAANDSPVGPKLLRITDIQDGRVDWTAVPYCEIGENDEGKFRLRDGDIVFARSGATTGKSYLVRNPPRAVFASYLIRVILKKDISPKYLYCFFQSPLYWSQLITRGIAQPNANAQVLGNLVVPLAPVAEQRRIVEKIEALFSKIDEAQECLHPIVLSDEGGSIGGKIDGLRKSILERALRGELVEQDTDDEPAEVLLDRIRKEDVEIDSRGKRHVK
jgi:type I restriction enzyme S subunit